MLTCKDEGNSQRIYIYEIYSQKKESIFQKLYNRLFLKPISFQEANFILKTMPHGAICKIEVYSMFSYENFYLPSYRRKKEKEFAKVNFHFTLKEGVVVGTYIIKMSDLDKIRKYYNKSFGINNTSYARQ